MIGIKRIISRGTIAIPSGVALSTSAAIVITASVAGIIATISIVDNPAVSIDLSYTVSGILAAYTISGYSTTPTPADPHTVSVGYTVSGISATYTTDAMTALVEY